MGGCTLFGKLGAPSAKMHLLREPVIRMLLFLAGLLNLTRAFHDSSARKGCWRMKKGFDG